MNQLNFYFQLTNAWFIYQWANQWATDKTGIHNAIAVDSSKKVVSVPMSANDDKQLWKLVDKGDGSYRIQNKSIGDGYSLDVDNYNTDFSISRGVCLNVNDDGKKGQVWRVTYWDIGPLKLYNDLMGKDYPFDTLGFETKIASGTPFDGQLWYLVISLENPIEDKSDSPGDKKSDSPGDKKP